jgi:hypothetical protein
VEIRPIGQDKEKKDGMNFDIIKSDKLFPEGG